MSLFIGLYVSICMPRIIKLYVTDLYATLIIGLYVTDLYATNYRIVCDGFFMPPIIRWYVRICMALIIGL